MLKTGHGLSEKEISKKYSKFAKELDMPKYFYKRVYTFLSSNTDLNGKKILDFGCGNGELLQIFVNNGVRSSNLYGVDVSPELIKLSKKKLKLKAKVKIYQGEKINFKDNFFDIILMTEVFEHLKDPKKTITELKRILKKGGILLITVPNGSAYRPFWDMVKNLRIKKLKKIFLPPEHPERTQQPIDTCYRWNEIIFILDQLELKRLKTSSREYFPYIVHFIWRKIDPQIGMGFGDFLNKNVGNLFDFFKLKRIGYRCFFLMQKIKKD